MVASYFGIHHIVACILTKESKLNFKAQIMEEY